MPTPAYNNQRITGDLAVTRHLALGGNANVQGNIHVGHNLTVDGWLEAPNIKDHNKGVFASYDSLLEHYPNPKPGWFAFVVNNQRDVELYVYSTEGEWHIEEIRDGLTIQTDIASLADIRDILDEGLEMRLDRTGDQLHLTLTYLDSQGTQQMTQVIIPSATGSMAGAMSANDKCALTTLDQDMVNAKADINEAEANIEDLQGRMSNAERNLNITKGTAQNALQTAQRCGCYPFGGIIEQQSLLPLKGEAEGLLYEIIFLAHGCNGDSTPRFVAKSGLNIYAEWPTSAHYVTDSGRPPQSALYSYNNKLYRFNGSALVEAHDMSALEDRIATAENDIDAAEGNITALQSGLATAQANINTANQDIERIGDQTGRVAVDVNNLKPRMTTAEGEITGLQTSVFSIQESLQFLQNALQENLYRATVSYIRGVRTDDDINLLSNSVITSGEPQIFWLEYYKCFAAKVGNSYYRSWGVQEGYDTFNLRYYANANGKPYTGKLYISLENLNTTALYRSTTGSTLTRFNTVTLVTNI